MDDFNSYTPAEDGSFDGAIISKCQTAYEEMNGGQQEACKCLVAVLAAKSAPMDVLRCDFARWKLIPVDELWETAMPWRRMSKRTN